MNLNSTANVKIVSKYSRGFDSIIFLSFGVSNVTHQAVIFQLKHGHNFIKRFIF